MAKAASYEVNEGTNSDFIPHVVPKQWNHLFSVGKLTLLGGHELTLSPASQPASQSTTHTVIHQSIHPSMHTFAYAPPYVYSDLSHGMLWVAGGNCLSNNHCDRYRGTRL